jgi:hypothetical protein
MQRWYANYVTSDQEIQDVEVFFHGIGNSIENARHADIVLLGTSRALFGLDWRVFDAFAQTHHIKMFNMAFAGVMAGEFSLMLAHKWNIHPRLWVIDLYAGPPGNFTSSFFNIAPTKRSLSEQLTYAEGGKVVGYKNVAIRNLRWRVNMWVKRVGPSTYRSSETGNWFLDNWPKRLNTDLPKITEAGNDNCSVEPEEIGAARYYLNELGGPAVLTEIPSKFSCIQRARGLADALPVALFAPSPKGYSSLDGGNHLDGISAAKYSAEFFTWLEQTSAFQQRFGH